MGGSINGGPPSHHLFLDGIFNEINNPFLGTPHLWNPPGAQRALNDLDTRLTTAGLFPQNLSDLIWAAPGSKTKLGQFISDYVQLPQLNRTSYLVCKLSYAL